MPDVHQRLLSLPPARVADIGCGVGWSSIGLAQAYPHIQVDGFDLDHPSIEVGRQNARDFAISERVNLQVRDAADPQLRGQYDLVMALECVHDMSDPVGVLRTMRAMAGAQGAVLIADERVGENFTPGGNEIEWMMYGWSVLHCLPVGMSSQPSRATGTVMRPATLREYALEAGFKEVTILPVENTFFRLYRLML
jgi:2-polyprenyl-3-methyl-5-hydroxy-6-metoxy-1,4-benzoquinol methylase